MDNHLGRQIWNEFDLADRPARLHVSDGAGNVLYRTKLGYDEYNNLSSFSEETEDGETFTTTYTYDTDNRPTAVQFGSNTEKVAYSYDALGRIATRTQYNGSSTPANTAAYSYLSGGQTETGYTSTTPLVSAIAQDEISFSYGYAADSNNIVSENRTGGSYAGETTYEYDTLGQLVRVNDLKDPAAGANGTTCIYAYDCGGNMTSRTAYPYTEGTPAGSGTATYYTYSSNWKDKLIAVGSTSLTYDLIGNLTNDGNWDYAWEAGRQLKRQVKAQGSSVSYGSVGMTTIIPACA